MAQAAHESKLRLLDATLKIVRIKGYSATRVEDICAEAGLTKGSFFHHFKSKEDLALAAAALWDARTVDTFAAAPYHRAADAVSRLIAYVEFRKAMLTGDLPDFTCFAGTIIQEAYRTHPDVSAACARSIDWQAKGLEVDIREAMRDHGLRGGWTAESLALHIVALIQGALLLAKVHGSAAVAIDCLDHVRRYIELLFNEAGQSAGRKAGQKTDRNAGKRRAGRAPPPKH